MTKYTTKKNAQAVEEILHINGSQSICPFVAAIPMQGKYGQVDIMRIPCTTACPHAQLNNNIYRITCGSSMQLFHIDKGNDIEVIEESKIIKLV